MLIYTQTLGYFAIPCIILFMLSCLSAVWSALTENEKTFNISGILAVLCFSGIITSIRFLPHLPVRVIALVNNVDAAVVAQAVCCGHFIQSALETMVEARNFIPGSQIAFGIKVIYHGNAFRRCRGATRDNQECSRNCSNDGQNAHGIFLAVFLLSVDDNRKKRERKEAQYPGPHRQLLQLFKNAPGRLDTDRVRIAFVCQHHDAKVFFWNEGYVAAKSTSGARFMHP